MGYQRVDVRLADGQELKDVVVFNAEEMDLPEEFANAAIADIRTHAARVRWTAIQSRAAGTKAARRPHREMYRASLSGEGGLAS